MTMTRISGGAFVAVFLVSFPVLAASDSPERDAIAHRFDGHAFDGHAFDGDAAAAEVALRLFDRDHVVVDVESAQTINGGFRGTIAIVPALPSGNERPHLVWTDAAFADFDAFFAALAPHETDVNYKFRPVTLRFFRSVGRTTPSAYARDWTIAYNVDGSLMTSETAVRETLFHEIFHLNDQAHGDWSERALAPIFAAITSKCGARTNCLMPYAPGTTKVRNGTYYAFHPGNGVGEYAAELALRYYREERAALRNEPFGARPFKCGPAENAQAWSAIVREFFGGIDRAPVCPM